MSVIDKYDRSASEYTARTYADPSSYFARKAELIRSLGPALVRGDEILEIGCGDAGLAPHLIALGFRYRGVDLSTEMIAVAERFLGDTGEISVGDMNSYVPPGSVAATLCFRALYYADDRVAFFRRVADFTERKLVFDFSPRRFDTATIRRELRAAGFDGIALRPFFVPTSRRLPRAALSLLTLLERTPLARPILAVRFSYLCAAWRA